MDDEPGPPGPWPLGDAALTADLAPAIAAAATIGAAVWAMVAMSSAVAGCGRRRGEKKKDEPSDRRASTRGGRYGLVAPVDGSESESETGSSPRRAAAPSCDDDDTPPPTVAAVNALARSPAFAAHLRARGMTYQSVAEVRKRLDLYRGLRAADAAAFRALVDRPPAAFETEPAPRLALILDWFLGPGAAAAAALLCAWPLALPTTVRAGATVLAALSALTAARSRSLMPGLWWEATATGTRAPGLRVIAAFLLDAFYSAATLGAGAAVALAARSARGPTLGEYAAGVALVRERRTPTEVR